MTTTSFDTKKTGVSTTTTTMTFKKSNPTTNGNESDAGNTKNNNSNASGVEALKGYYYTGSQLNNQYNRTT
jgi:hypothetical protein